MSKTVYHYTVTLKCFDEDVVRLVPATKRRLAIKEFKKKMFENEFWKKEKYTIDAKIILHDKGTRPDFIWPHGDLK